MLYLNRCVDLDNDAIWVAVDLDKEKSRCRQLYCGKDVNGAVKAIVSAGMKRADAEAEVRRILNRKFDEVVDTLNKE